MQGEFADVPPRASAVLHSLRAVGYDLPTAIADVIDNSLAAGAHSVRVDMRYDAASSYVRIEDDGAGMDAPVLEAAMRLGSQHPSSQRASTDHGRFGLGLKTASFGQCRRLTVRTRGPAGAQETRSWDLDHIEQVDSWALRRSTWDSASEDRAGVIPGDRTGTIVLWEKLDRVVEAPGHATAHADFDRKISETVDHLSMVFHRLIDARDNPVLIEVNGRQLEGWDPLLSRNKFTRQLRDTQLVVAGARMLIAPYIIPPESRLSPEDARRAAGPRGWLAHQGFYLYRNRRLLVTGGWLGLARREAQHSLARIRLDVDNQLDDLLRIDIRKARARIPDQVRPRVQGIVDATRKKAAEVWRAHAVRSSPGLQGDIVPVWLVDGSAARPRFSINPEHPAIKAVRARLTGDTAELLAAMLDLVSSSFPVDVLLQMAGAHPAVTPPPSSEVPVELRSMTREIIRSLQAAGTTPDEIRRRLSLVEPWASMPPGRLDALLEMSS